MSAGSPPPGGAQACLRALVELAMPVAATPLGPRRLAAAMRDDAHLLGTVHDLAAELRSLTGAISLLTNAVEEAQDRHREMVLAPKVRALSRARTSTNGFVTRLPP